MVRDRCNYFSFWAIFCTFISLPPTPPPPPLTAQKLKLKKNEKNPRDIITLQLYTCVPKIMIR